MSRFQNIITLVQPRTDDLIAVKKSIVLAQRNNAELTILFVKPKRTIYSNWINQQSHNEVNIEPQVASILAFAKKSGISAVVNIVEDNMVSHALEQQFNKISYDLVVAEHQPENFRLWPFDEKEYHKLLNATDSAMLFVGRHQWREHGHILAAIETEENSTTHQHFNQAIVEKSDEIAQLLLSDIHCVSCYSKSCLISFDDNQAMSANAEYATHLAHLSSLVAPYQLAHDSLHIKEGLADDVIPEQAQELDANLVVIGCSEHKGMIANIQGHTIDFVLDRLSCDVLAIQPDIFH